MFWGSKPMRFTPKMLGSVHSWWSSLLSSLKPPFGSDKNAVGSGLRGAAGSCSVALPLGFVVFFSYELTFKWQGLDGEIDEHGRTFRIKILNYIWNIFLLESMNLHHCFYLSCSCKVYDVAFAKSLLDLGSFSCNCTCHHFMAGGSLVDFESQLMY